MVHPIIGRYTSVQLLLLYYTLFVCAVARAEVVHKCAAVDDPSVLISCPPKHSISILSAEAGSIVNWNPRAKCEQIRSTCMLSIGPLAAACNKTAVCILNNHFNFNLSQCASNDSMNVVKVAYNCTKGE